MKLSGRTLSVTAIGVVATLVAAAIGLKTLERRLHKQRPSQEEYFFDDARLNARLADSETFSSPRIGYAGQPPSIAPEFTRMMADGKAEEKLQALVSHGASGGLLYGLCGMKILGSKHFDPARSLVSRQDDRRVALRRGCVLSVTTPRDLVLGSVFESVCDEWKATIREAALPNPALNPTGLRPAG